LAALSVRKLAEYQRRARLALALAPIALPQGLIVKRRIPRLPEAPGQRYGQVGQGRSCLHLVALGESPLAGVGLEDQGQALTAHLAEWLARRAGRPVSWQASARGGVTARRTRTELLAALAERPADLAVIGLGVNDSLALASHQRWQHDLTELIEKLRQRIGPAPVILAGVPDMARFPALPAPLSILLGTRSRLLDAAAADLAERLERVWHIPMPLDAGSAALFCHDGFHPSAEGHRRWAELIAESCLERADFRALIEPISDTRA
jgi:lysophospholipase L1-like esterase